MGDSLRLVRAADSTPGAAVTGAAAVYWACVCGHLLAHGDQNWKTAMATRFSRAESQPARTLHQDLELREYACPACGVLHGVEVALAQEDSVFDARLTWSANSRPAGPRSRPAAQ